MEGWAEGLAEVMEAALAEGREVVMGADWVEGLVAGVEAGWAVA